MLKEKSSGCKLLPFSFYSHPRPIHPVDTPAILHRMKLLVSGLLLILSRKDSRAVIIISTVTLFFILLLVQNGEASFDILSFTVLSLTDRAILFLRTLFDIQNTFTTSSLLLATLGSLLAGINISLAYTYVRMRGEIILQSGLYSGLGLFLAFVGIGCAACGTALLSIILSFFGFSTMLSVLPYKGEEIGYIGLIILCIATYTLAKKVTAPNVC